MIQSLYIYIYIYPQTDTAGTKKTPYLIFFIRNTEKCSISGHSVMVSRRLLWRKGRNSLNSPGMSPLCEPGAELD